MTPLRTLVGVLPILQDCVCDRYVVTVVAMTLYREGFGLDYEFSLHDANDAFPTSFPGPDAEQSGTVLTLRARCIDDSGGVYTSLHRTLSMGDEHKVFFRSVFSPAIDAAATRLLIQIAAVERNEYEPAGRIRARHRLAGVHFEFDVDLGRLVKYEGMRGA